MGLLDSLKTAFANLPPSVNMDQTAEDIAYLKAATDILADNETITYIPGTDIEIGTPVVPAAFALPCMFYADTDPAITLVDGVDTLVPMRVLDDLGTGIGTDVTIVAGVPTVQVSGVYSIHMLAQGEWSGTDESANTAVDFRGYLVYNDESFGPFYYFGKVTNEIAGEATNPIEFQHNVTCYLEAGDELQPQVNLNAAPLLANGECTEVYLLFQRVA